MNPSLLALGTAVPRFVYLQSEAAKKTIELFGLNKEKSESVRRIYENSAIHKRYTVVSDFTTSRSEWQFLEKEYPQIVPGMSKRNHLYKEEAPKLAHAAAVKAIAAWGGKISEITHIIYVSCTGLMAPGVEFLLIQSLGLNRSVCRLAINFMGCFGAFKGLSVANSFARENSNHRILLVCTELCSLHVQAKLDSESITGNALFADGSAAAIIGSHPKTNETSLWEIEKFYSYALDNTLDKMSWEVSDHGCVMRLLPAVPVLIGRYIAPFLKELLSKEEALASCDWAMHPGGKSILKAIQKAIGIDKSMMQASWDILAEYGNMSSATFLFVLERLLQRKEKKPRTIGAAFGPGLSMEGVILR